MPPIKAQIQKYLTAFCVANGAFVYCALSVPPSLKLAALTASFTDNWFKKVTLTLIATVLSVALDSLASRTFKTRLIFWRWRDPEPGSRAFSVIARNDSRIDIEVLQKALGTLPSGPSEENRIWYKIFKSCELAPSVAWAHRNWLLMRDLTFLSAVFFSLGLVAWAISGAPLNAGYISGLVTAGEFSLFLCAARRHGIDLVANVLAEYACQKGVSVTSKG